MKSFRYIHSIAVWIMTAIILILSGVGIYFNVYSAFNCNGVVFKIISYSILAFICLTLCVAVLSVMLKSRYVIKDGMLCLYFGFISVKTDIKDMVSITLVEKGNRLVAEFSNLRFSAIVIKDTFYDEFIKAVKEINPEVVYNIEHNKENDQDE